MEEHPPRVPRAQARREMALFVGVIAVVVATVLTLGWWISLLEKLSSLTASALLVAGVGILVLSRGRRGAAWVLARSGVVAIAIAIVVVVFFFSVCVATQCVR